MPPEVPQRKTPEMMLRDLGLSMHTLDSKVELLKQQLNTLESNQEVIGRTIVLHNTRLQEMERKIAGLAGGPAAGAAPPEEIEALRKEIALLKESAEMMSKTAVSKEDFERIQYIVESINPLEYVTLSQIDKLLDEKLKKKK